MKKAHVLLIVILTAVGVLLSAVWIVEVGVRDPAERAQMAEAVAAKAYRACVFGSLLQAGFENVDLPSDSEFGNPPGLAEVEIWANRSFEDDPVMAGQLLSEAAACHVAASGHMYPAQEYPAALQRAITMLAAIVSMALSLAALSRTRSREQGRDSGGNGGATGPRPSEPNDSE